jgi:hypothetical protein
MAKIVKIGRGGIAGKPRDEWRGMTVHFSREEQNPQRNGGEGELMKREGCAGTKKQVKLLRGRLSISRLYGR